jgi:hypothetical protein
MWRTCEHGCCLRFKQGRQLAETNLWVNLELDVLQHLKGCRTCALI